MQYIIQPNGLQPNTQQRQKIKAELGLSLSRYNALIEQCTVYFTEAEQNTNESIIFCCISILLKNSEKIAIKDSSNSLPSAFSMAVRRMKKNIERQVKRSHAIKMSAPG